MPERLRSDRRERESRRRHRAGSAAEGRLWYEVTQPLVADTLCLRLVVAGQREDSRERAVGVEGVTCVVFEFHSPVFCHPTAND